MTARGRRTRVLCAAVAVLVLGAAACSPSSEPPDDGDGGTLARPFADDSPWNSPIPSDPDIERGSDVMVDVLVQGGGGHALLYEYGVPVFEGDADSPRATVRCTQTEWGTCPLEGDSIPLPPGTEPSPGTDGAMVIIDRETGRVYDFWQATIEGDEVTASWGTWTTLTDDGIGGEAGGPAGGSTAAGINLLAGLVRTDEIRSGLIDHALALVSQHSCADVFRYPASKTDGRAMPPVCVPQGARLQLDPEIDVAAIPGITPGEVAVARALQTYGAYLRDSAGTALGVVFESPVGEDDPYPEIAGFPWDYYNMPHIPWDRLRVLSSWDGR